MHYSQNVRVIFLMTLSVLLTSWIVSGKQFVENMEIRVNNDNDTGRATKCDPSDPIKAAVTWKPKDLSPSGQVNVTVSYKAPHDFNHGVINGSLYFHGEPEPFLGYANIITCKDIPQFFHCPIKKGTSITTPPLNIANLHLLTSFPGDYDLIIEVKNEFQERMFCLNISVHINEI